MQLPRQELTLRIAVTTSPDLSWTVLQVHLKLGLNIPLSAKRNLFCKIYWQHCVAATLRAHCATVCTPRNF